MRIDDDLLTRVRAVPVTTVWEALGLAWVRSGNWAHAKGDKSLKADLKGNTYHDFSGKYGRGGVVDFVMAFQGWGFREAVEYLATAHLGEVLATAPARPPAPRRAAPPLPEPPPEAQKCYIPADLVAKYLARYGHNALAVYAAQALGLPLAKVAGTFAQYRVGTGKQGEAAFFYCDLAGRVETVKLMGYGPDGHRASTRTPREYTKDRGHERSGLWGLHLLNLPENRESIVLMVEAEKTAALAALVFPGLVCLATGGKENLLPKYWAALVGRNVVVLPDADPRGENDARQLWRGAVKAMRADGVNARYLDLCPKREDKTDLADYLAGEPGGAWADRLQTMIDSFRPRQPEPEALPEPAPTTPAPAIAPAPEPAPAPTIGHGDYVAGLYMEAGRLMAPGGYPASWDTCAPYLAQETRHFAALAAKNPPVLDLVQGLGLEVSASGALLPPREQAPKDSWAVEVEGLAKWFAGAVLPPGPVSLGGGGTVTDCRKLIDAHLEVAKANDGKATFLPYLERLRQLKDQLAASQPAQQKPLEP
jgi:hypothetical protein